MGFYARWSTRSGGGEAGVSYLADDHDSKKDPKLSQAEVSYIARMDEGWKTNLEGGRIPLEGHGALEGIQDQNHLGIAFEESTLPPFTNGGPKQGYLSITFTVPKEISLYAEGHRGEVRSILHGATESALEKAYPGIQVSAVSAVHTRNENGEVHHHVHALVSKFGWHEGRGKWISLNGKHGGDPNSRIREGKDAFAASVVRQMEQHLGVKVEVGQKGRATLTLPDGTRLEPLNRNSRRDLEKQIAPVPRGMKRPLNLTSMDAKILEVAAQKLGRQGWNREAFLRTFSRDAAKVDRFEVRVRTLQSIGYLNERGRITDAFMAHARLKWGEETPQLQQLRAEAHRQAMKGREGEKSTLRLADMAKEIPTVKARLEALGLTSKQVDRIDDLRAALYLRNHPAEKAFYKVQEELKNLPRDLRLQLDKAKDVDQRVQLREAFQEREQTLLGQLREQRAHIHSLVERGELPGSRVLQDFKSEERAIQLLERRLRDTPQEMERRLSGVSDPTQAQDLRQALEQEIKGLQESLVTLKVQLSAVREDFGAPRAEAERPIADGSPRLVPPESILRDEKWASMAQELRSLEAGYLAKVQGEVPSERTARMEGLLARETALRNERGALESAQARTPEEKAWAQERAGLSSQVLDRRQALIQAEKNLGSLHAERHKAAREGGREALRQEPSFIQKEVSLLREKHQIEKDLVNLRAGETGSFGSREHLASLKALEVRQEAVLQRARSGAEPSRAQPDPSREKPTRPQREPVAPSAARVQVQETLRQARSDLASIRAEIKEVSRLKGPEAHARGAALDLREAALEARVRDLQMKALEARHQDKGTLATPALARDLANLQARQAAAASRSEAWREVRAATREVREIRREGKGASVEKRPDLEHRLREASLRRVDAEARGRGTAGTPAHDIRRQEAHRAKLPAGPEGKGQNMGRGAGAAGHLAQRVALKGAPPEVQHAARHLMQARQFAALAQGRGGHRMAFSYVTHALPPEVQKVVQLFRPLVTALQASRAVAKAVPREAIPRDRVEQLTRGIKEHIRQGAPESEHLRPWKGREEALAQRLAAGGQGKTPLPEPTRQAAIEAGRTGCRLVAAEAPKESLRAPSNLEPYRKDMETLNARFAAYRLEPPFNQEALGSLSKAQLEGVLRDPGVQKLLEPGTRWANLPNAAVAVPHLAVAKAVMRALEAGKGLMKDLGS